jgi:hypothetical protein
MPTDKEFAEMAVEAEQEVAELFQEYLKEARGKQRRKRQVQPEMPMLTPPPGQGGVPMPMQTQPPGQGGAPMPQVSAGSDY